ncbi:hypothetical protein [Brevibacillus choshinensis]|nr:hypothetical protein [Brevibacillus choshinensis]
MLNMDMPSPKQNWPAERTRAVIPSEPNAIGANGPPYAAIVQELITTVPIPNRRKMLAGQRGMQ